jgi:molecular chaperone Hsp33
MNRDYLLKAVDKDKQARIYVARTTRLVEEAHRRHGTSATASAALGRVLTAALMMGSDLKGLDDVVTLRFDGNGPGGVVVATADGRGRVKGLIGNPRADLPSAAPGKLAVGALVGTQGFLEVVKDLGLKQPFVGRVPLVSGEIAEDLAQYFLQSEQIPALVSLGVLVAPDLSILASGGLFVQALPGAADEILQTLEDNILAMGAISTVLYTHEGLEQILPLIFGDIEYNVIEEHDLEFFCACSHERLAAILAKLPDEEIIQASRDNEEIEAVCNFCQERYLFKAEEIWDYKKQQALDS